MKAPEQSQTKSQTRCYSPDYGAFCAPWVSCLIQSESGVVDLSH